MRTVIITGAAGAIGRALIEALADGPYRLGLVDLPGAPLSDLEWFDLVQGCVAADLVGFLAAADGAGRLPVTPGQADELAALDAERAGSTRLVERRAVTVAAVLAAAGIDHRIVDGPARRLAYGDAYAGAWGILLVLAVGSFWDSASGAAHQGR